MRARVCGNGAAQDLRNVLSCFEDLTRALASCCTHCPPHLRHRERHALHGADAEIAADGGRPVARQVEDAWRHDHHVARTQRQHGAAGGVHKFLVVE